MKITIRDMLGRIVYSADSARRLCEHLSACGHAGPLAPEQVNQLSVEVADDAGRVIYSEHTLAE